MKTKTIVYAGVGAGAVYVLFFTDIPRQFAAFMRRKWNQANALYFDARVNTINERSDIREAIQSSSGMAEQTLTNQLGLTESGYAGLSPRSYG